ncbi:MAG: YdcF family protein [Solobacterium sp.]|nr:YdcF family protein [Solobacterium sp.]
MGKVKFDTLSRKPHLFGLLPLAGATALVLLVLAAHGSKSYALAECIVIILFCTAVLVSLGRAWVGQLRYNPYSYNTIYYVGFFVFTFFILITNLILAVRLIAGGIEVTALTVPQVLLNSATNFILLTLPSIIAFTAALCYSNVHLICYEGFRFVNLLGILLSAALLGGALILLAAGWIPSGAGRSGFVRDLIVNLAAAAYLYFECMIIGISVAYIVVCRYEPDPDRDFVIIPGCGLRADGTPSPLLQGRIDRALEFWRKQAEMTGKTLIFVPSGGQGPDEIVSESESMKRYLMEHGVPEEQIIKEDQSTSTYENMKFSRAKIYEVNPEGRIAFSTTNYHVFRAGLFARRVKMKAIGMSSPTKWYFWPNAAVREFVGLLSEHRGKQFLIFGGMMVFYTVLTMIVHSIL